MRCAILLFVSVPLAGQQATAPVESHAPSVEGKVVNIANGEGVRKATVLLRAQNGPNGINYTADSDGNGRFLIENVEPGKYMVSADRQGFMLQATGATGAPPPPITVENGQELHDVIVRLSPLGVIAGRVVDDDGDPIRGSQVQAMSYRYTAGKRQLGNAQQAESNDKGEFRLYGLRPGTYYLYAGVSNYNSNRNQEAIRGPRPPGRAATYFPNAADAAHAVPIELAAGAQLRGFDIHMRRERVFSVRGKLPESADRSNRRYFVRVAPRDSNLNFSSFGSTMNNNATFECPGLPPGEYVLMATMYDGDKQIPARQVVNIVDSDVEVTLNFSPPSDVSGMVRVEGQTSKALEDLRVSLQPEGQSAFGVSATIKANGAFVLRNVTPDVYLVNFNAPDGTYVKSIGAGDQDASNWRVDLTKGSGPIAITLGTDIGVVEGTVENAAGEPAVRVRVNLIPYGNHLGRPDLGRFAFTDEKGHFRMRGTAPGEYKLFAWDNVEPGAPQDPEFRKPFEKQAVPVKLQPNGQESVKLKLIHVDAARQ